VIALAALFSYVTTGSSPADDDRRHADRPRHVPQALLAADSARVARASHGRGKFVGRLDFRALVMEGMPSLAALRGRPRRLT